MEATRPRSVLAAFQEHLQLASSKCGSLMEQLSIVRKKVEGEEEVMSVTESMSNHLVEKVSEESVHHTEGPYLDCKETFNGDQIMFVDGKDQLINDQVSDVHQPIAITRKDSEHSQVTLKEEQKAFLVNEKNIDLENGTPPIIYSQGLEDRPDDEKVSGKSGVQFSMDKDSKCLTLEPSSDDESTLSSYSSSSKACQNTSEKQTAYEELLKILKNNEGNKLPNKSKSSSENSSSTVPRSLQSNKSPKFNFSDIAVDGVAKKNCEIDNLNTSGVDFFLPSGPEKFQGMFYEDSDEEGQDNNSKEKQARVKFHDMSLSRFIDTKTEKFKKNKVNISHKLDEMNSLPCKTKQLKKGSCQQEPRTEKTLDISSVHTKSETQMSKKVTTSTVDINSKLHSPELNLYKKLNTTPSSKFEVKRVSGKKEIKAKRTPVVNLKMKTTKSEKKGHEPQDLSKLNILDKSNIIKDVSNTKKKKKIVQNISRIITTKRDTGMENKHFQNSTENEVIISKPKTANNCTNVQNNNGMKPDSLDVMFSSLESVKNDKMKNLNANQPLPKKPYANNSKNFIQMHEKLLKTTKNNVASKVNNQGLLQSVNVTQTPKTPPCSIQIIDKEKPIKNLNTILPAMNTQSKRNTLSKFSLPVSNAKKEQHKINITKKDNKFDSENFQDVNVNIKNKGHNENSTRKRDLSKETIYSQNINDMKTLTSSFPFILGQSTTKSYNVRAAIQQTMSMIMKSPAETLRRSSFSEMLNVSSKGSSHKSCTSYGSGRKLCPACIIKVEEEDDVEETPIDPWDTEYHSKRFVRCTCMPRNTVNFKTVMNQLLVETSSSCPVTSEIYQESELENGEDNRVNNSFFRRNNNIYKLSKLLHTLIRIRDLLIS